MHAQISLLLGCNLVLINCFFWRHPCFFVFASRTILSEMWAFLSSLAKMLFHAFTEHCESKIARPSTWAQTTTAVVLHACVGVFRHEAAALLAGRLGPGPVPLLAVAARPVAAADTTSTTAMGKKAKKPAAKAAAAADDVDDLDALLADLAGGGGGGGGKAAAPATKPAAAPAKPEDGGAAGDDGDGDGDGDGEKELTAAQKKRLKKKQAAAKAKAAPAASDAGGKATAGGAGAPKKKESAAVRRMREAVEAQRAAEEAAAAAAAAEAARVAEEERRAVEAAEQAAAIKAAKKEADRARREQLRKEGKLLSKTERARQERAAQFREQLEASGAIPAAAGDGTDGKKKKVVYGSKKGGRGKGATATGKAAAAAEAATVAAAAAEAEESEDDWEATAEAIVSNVSGIALPSAPEEDEELAAVEAEAAAAFSTLNVKSPDEDDTRGGGKRSTKKGAPKRPAGAKAAKAAKAAAKAAAAAANGGSSSESDGSDDDSSGSSGSDSDSDSDSSGSSDRRGPTAAAVAAKRRAELAAARAERAAAAQDARSPDRLRSPIVCILGHVDTGKTKILDKIRKTNVQDGEAGGITQQIGATFFPLDAVKRETSKLALGRALEHNIPALLIIDTPGHESFTNLRSRGSSLCDIAILVVDIMHGLEPQTMESIELLKQRKTPFIVALNKVDRLYDWKAKPMTPVIEALPAQKRHVQDEFKRRLAETKVAFAELGFNSEVYWENDDVRGQVSLVPTSAISGEGIPDLLYLLVSLTQNLMRDRLMWTTHVECTVLEVKMIEGLGTTIDVILTGGTLKEGDTIVVCGLDGAIVTTVRALLTPHPMKEMRVKGQFLRHGSIEAAQGIKISADGLDRAVAGTQLLITEDGGSEEELDLLRDEVMKDFATILTAVDKSGLGVYVQASTLGSLEALLSFLKSSNIPVAGLNIGPVHKKDIVKASTMLERKKKEYATVLAFDVPVEREARELAEELDMRIFTADIIYHLFDQFTAYMDDIREQQRDAAAEEVVFPSICRIIPQMVFNKKNPIVLGVDVEAGILRVQTPLVVKLPTGAWLDIGRVASIELAKKSVTTAKKGESVAIKVVCKNENLMFGRHFDGTQPLVSKMSRKAIDLLKLNFRDELGKDDWRLVVKLKGMFGIE